MDCAGFERQLVELLDGSAASNAQERDLRLRALRAHAADCDACVGCEDLLQLLELPRGQRELDSDPGQAYWDAFDRRVRERVRLESTRAKPTGRWWIAAAPQVKRLARWQDCRLRSKTYYAPRAKSHRADRRCSRIFGRPTTRP